MTELTNYAIGFLLMTILFSCSYLFWNWYSTKDKKEFSYNFKENNNNNNNNETENSSSSSSLNLNEKEEEDPTKTIEKLLSKNNNSELSGSTDKYNWTQNEKELEVYINVTSNIKGKDINCKIRSNHLTLKINNNTIIDGDFYATVVPDECNWQIEGDGENRRVWISLFKEVPTTKNQHWKCVIKGDAEIDTSSLGPPVHHLDVNDKNGLQDALRKVSKYKS